MAAPRRTDVVHRAVGTVSVERYRVPVYEREAPLDTAVGLRLTRMDVDTGRIEDAVDASAPPCAAAGRSRRVLRRAAAGRPGHRAFQQRCDRDSLWGWPPARRGGSVTVRHGPGEGRPVREVGEGGLC